MEASSGPDRRFELIDEGDYLRLSWTPFITLQLEDVQASVAAVEAASTGGKRPLLVHMNLTDAITAEAREFLLQETCSSRTAVLGKDEVTRVVTAFNYRAVTPSRYFTNESEAISWLTVDNPSAEGSAGQGF